MNFNWVIVGASAIGEGHIEKNQPCQDSFAYEMINKDWGIAIISDGAGSFANSEIGSKFIVEQGLKLFKDYLIKEVFIKKNKLPSNKLWRNISNKNLKILHKNLKRFSKKEKLEFKSLGSTLILLVFSRIGILSTHIGDGRAGYCSDDLQWYSAITPFSGEQVGSTVFLTTDYVWKDTDIYIETRVIETEVKAFTLLSDGCENGCFECYTKKDDVEEFYDPNKPFDKFFNPNISVLKKLDADGLSKEEMNKKWQTFLTNGNEAFKIESDDKTMILGVFK